MEIFLKLTLLSGEISSYIDTKTLCPIVHKKNYTERPVKGKGKIEENMQKVKEEKI